MKIIIATKERFSIKLAAGELDRLRCFGDLDSVIMSKVDGKPSTRQLKVGVPGLSI
jgi:hypothetical protein